MISRSELGFCCASFHEPRPVVVYGPDDEDNPPFQLCAECLCAALEVVTPYKWRGQLDAFRASTANSERARRENPRRKPGPYARAKARETSGHEV